MILLLILLYNIAPSTNKSVLVNNTTTEVSTTPKPMLSTTSFQANQNESTGSSFFTNIKVGQ